MEAISQFVPLIAMFIIFKIVFKWEIPFLNFLKKKIQVNRFSHEIPINNHDNIILKLHKERDRLYEYFNTISLELDMDIECVKSSSFDMTTWVACRFISKKNDFLRKESYVDIELIPIPFHIYDICFSIELNTGYYKKNFKNIIAMTENDITKILQIMISNSGYINYRPIRYSNSSFIFWRPKNKLIKEYQETFFSSINISFLGISAFEKPLFYKITTGRPSFEPRLFIKLDSWQTVINNIGNLKDSIMLELMTKISNLEVKDKYLQTIIEKEWYWGLNGKDEREQLVCIFNRAYVIIYIYNYGNNLYIGWDANLNHATWEEYQIAEGYLGIRLHTIYPAWKELNNYDLNDMNFLLETIHSNITQIIKRVIKEQKIDQEIDFSIVRESRSDVLKAEKAKEDKNKNRFKRLA